MKRIYYCCLLAILFLGIAPKLIAQNVLDLVGLNETVTPSVAYSVRKLSSTYTGYSIKVRRSSDNTSMDIGFTSGGELDITALLSFTGIGEAFVETWYDQSGNNKHLTQASTSYQPRIVSNGNLELENGKPFIRFFGQIVGNSHSLNLATDMNTTGHVSVVNKFAAGGDGFILGHTSYYYWHTSPSTNQLVDFSNAGSSYKTGKFWQNGTSVAPSSAVFNTSLMVHSIVPSNGSTQTTWNNIGSDRNLYHNTSGGGGYAELIIFSSELTVYFRNSLAANQGTYFGITVERLKYLNKYGQMVTTEAEFINRNGELGNSGIFSNGESFSRTALAAAPVTSSIHSITSYSAVSGGSISLDNGANLRAGVCWGTSPSPTILNSKTLDMGKSGTFISILKGLRGNTLYYMRSYASNNLGTLYGNELSFTTNASVIPLFSGNNIVSSIKATSAMVESNLSSDGGEPITEKGFCWSTNPNPTISDSKTTSIDPSLGVFSATITGLTISTTYHVRAYATNSVGTSYSDALSFNSSSTYSIGERYQGGIIAYIFNNTDPGYVTGETHGLIVAENDASLARWSSSLSRSLGTDTRIGIGKTNTTLINAYTGSSTTWAAYLSSSQTLGGYTDWYLPSKDELYKIYLNKNLLPNFRSSRYWTSSQSSTNFSTAWTQHFGIGSQLTSSVGSLFYVRPVRTF